jgi:hypothetical protein
MGRNKELLCLVRIELSISQFSGRPTVNHNPEWKKDYRAITLKDLLNAEACCMESNELQI